MLTMLFRKSTTMACLGIIACGGQQGASPAGGGVAPAATGTTGGQSSPDPTATPSKALFLRRLEALAADIEGGRVEALVQHFVTPPGITPQELDRELKRFITHKTFTKYGLKLLTARGKFGPFSDGWPRDGKSEAKGMKLNVAECYALSFNEAVVMAHWTGSEFKVFFVDGVDELVEKAPVELGSDAESLNL